RAGRGLARPPEGPIHRGRPPQRRRPRPPASCPRRAERPLRDHPTALSARLDRPHLEPGHRGVAATLRRRPPRQRRHGPPPPPRPHHRDGRGHLPQPAAREARSRRPQRVRAGELTTISLAAPRVPAAHASPAPGRTAECAVSLAAPTAIVLPAP